MMHYCPQDPTASNITGGPFQVSSSNHADAFETWAQKAFIAAEMQL